MDKQFGKRILDYKDDILSDLNKLMEIPSVANINEATDDAPFGKESKKALTWIMNRADELGLTARNIDNKAGHAAYGAGEDYVAMVSHIDVVPAGVGWEQENPYQLVEKDDDYRGRGIIDNKGPAIITLYCLKALKDAGITGKHDIRAIFGTGEEINSDDMEIYFKSEPLPRMAFTPDSSYGICVAEKGLQRIAFKDVANDNKILKSFKAGTVVNVVPNRATAVIECTDEEANNVKKIAKNIDCEYDFTYQNGELNIVSHGISAHATKPQEGKNAVMYLVELLTKSFAEEKIGSFLYFLNNYIGHTFNGEKLNVNFKDVPSGKLTLSLNLINIDTDICEAVSDIRFPVTFKKLEIIERIAEVANKQGVEIEDIGGMKPLYLPETLPLISILKSSYKNITNNDATIISTGGGTYARDLHSTGVAFGPCFNSAYNRIHDVGERANIKEFWLHAQICLQAAYEMLMDEK